MRQPQQHKPNHALNVRAAVLICQLLLSSNAWAYETDQLTDRQIPLDDILIEANYHMNVMINTAIDATNQKLSCEADPAKTRRVLSKLLHTETSKSVRVARRGPLRQYGFQAYSAWIEGGEVPRRDFMERDDIFGGIGPDTSWVLTFAGPCSTVNVNGVLLGTDKLDHFLDLGYWYALESRFGLKPEKGLRYGTRTERTIYGLWTSKAFSYGDLKANWDGYLFYRQLFTLDSPIGLGTDGCVYQKAAFDWANWITWEYDEALNPSVYRTRVQQALRARFEGDTDRYCPAWRALNEERASQSLKSDFQYVDDRRPEQTDPFDLSDLCP